MNTAHYITLISYVIWLFPIFKQKGTDYFSAFYILMLADPTRLFLYYFFDISPYSYHQLFVFMILFVLSRKQYKIYIALACVSTIFAINLPGMDNHLSVFVSSVGHLIITMILCLKLFEKFSTEKVANLFLILFISYEFLNVYKLLTYSIFLSAKIGTYIGTFLQFFFAIAFTFINIDTKNYSLKFLLKEKTDS